MSIMRMDWELINVNSKSMTNSCSNRTFSHVDDSLKTEIRNIGRNDYISEYAKFLMRDSIELDISIARRKANFNCIKDQSSFPRVQKIKELSLNCRAVNIHTQRQDKVSDKKPELRTECIVQQKQDVSNTTTELCCDSSKSKPYNKKSKLGMECTIQPLTIKPKNEQLNRTLKVLVERLPKHLVDDLLAQNKKASKESELSGDAQLPNLASESSTGRNTAGHGENQLLIKQAYVLLKRLPIESDIHNICNKKTAIQETVNNLKVDDGAKEHELQQRSNSPNILPRQWPLQKFSSDCTNKDSVYKKLNCKNVSVYLTSIDTINKNAVSKRSIKSVTQESVQHERLHSPSRLASPQQSVDEPCISEKEEKSSSNKHMENNDTHLHIPPLNKICSANTSSTEVTNPLLRTKMVNRNSKGNQPRRKNNLLMLTVRQLRSRALDTVKRRNLKRARNLFRHSTVQHKLKQKIISNDKTSKRQERTKHHNIHKNNPVLSSKEDLKSTNIINKTSRQQKVCTTDDSKSQNQQIETLQRKSNKAEHSSLVCRKRILTQIKSERQLQRNKHVSLNNKENNQMICKPAKSFCHLNKQPLADSSMVDAPEKKHQSRSRKPNSKYFGVPEQIECQFRKKNNKSTLRRDPIPHLPTDTFQSSTLQNGSKKTPLLESSVTTSAQKNLLTRKRKKTEAKLQENQLTRTRKRAEANVQENRLTRKRKKAETNVQENLLTRKRKRVEEKVRENQLIRKRKKAEVNLQETLLRKRKTKANVQETLLRKHKKAEANVQTTLLRKRKKAEINVQEALLRKRKRANANVLLNLSPRKRKTVDGNNQLFHPTSQDSLQLINLSNNMQVVSEDIYDSCLIIDSSAAGDRLERNCSNFLNKFEQNTPLCCSPKDQQIKTNKRPYKRKKDNCFLKTYFQPQTLAAIALQSFFGNTIVKEMCYPK